MVDRAFTWAQSNNRIRTNEIHGEQEIQVVLNEKFEVSNVDVEEVERCGNITVQDIWFPMCCYVSYLLPEFIDIILTVNTFTAWTKPCNFPHLLLPRTKRAPFSILKSLMRAVLRMPCCQQVPDKPPKLPSPIPQQS